MSADFINRIGSGSPSYIPSVRPTGNSGAAGGTGEASGAEETSGAGAPEGFTPTTEAGETNQDTKAGEARASEIFSAWGAGSGPPAPSAGKLSVDGAENTSVNQAYSATGGQPGGADPGFTGATVFSSKPPG